MAKKLSKFDFQYLVEAAQAFERQIKGVRSYPDPIEENRLIVIHKDLMKTYELSSFNDDYQVWIDDFKFVLDEVQKENHSFER